MFALDVATGTRLWTTPAPEPVCLDKAGCGAAQMAPATALVDAVFSASLGGHIRAYDVLDGKVIWDFDTTANFPTVNGVEAHGGSINYAGTVVAGGIVFVASGYSFNAGMAGNVLLAFTVDGK
jgi:polyvinyl alcohol dehydrogenase (cytochrome)